MLENLDKQNRLEIVKTIHRIEGLIDNLPQAIADAVSDAVVKALDGDDLPDIEAVPDDIVDGSGGISTV